MKRGTSCLVATLMMVLGACAETGPAKDTGGGRPQSRADGDADGVADAEDTCPGFDDSRCVGGRCQDGECVCDAGWSGEFCAECDTGFFGANCLPCECENGTCDDGVNGSGQCTSCDEGWTGEQCDACAAGHVGPDCVACNCVNGTCGSDGTCSSCAAGWAGDNCNQCAEGYFGADCAPCSCANGQCIDGRSGTGTCSSCDAGWLGPNCTQPDGDTDGIPDVQDPFPSDENKPWPTEPNQLFAHTPEKLFSLDILDAYALTEVGNFSFVGAPVQDPVPTDLALDQWNVLYVITFDDLFVCNPETAECHWLAQMPASVNGLTFVPPGVLQQDSDTLIAMNQQSWYQVDINGGDIVWNEISGYPGDIESSGDLVSMAGVGTFGSVDMTGEPEEPDAIIPVDPAAGTVGQAVVELQAYTEVFGLAGWREEVIAFDAATGHILDVDIDTGDVTLIQDTPYQWYGAGVTTVLTK